MANWAQTVVCFHSTEYNEIKELYDSIHSICSKKDMVWFTDLLTELNLKLPEDRRGYIFDYGDIPDKDQEDEEYCFTLYTEDAWYIKTEVWETVCEKYPSISYDYLCEETGAGLYVNSDITGRYFPEKYFVEIDDIDFYEYFDRDLSEENLMKLISEKVHKDFSTIQDFNKSGWGIVHEFQRDYFA